MIWRFLFLISLLLGFLSITLETYAYTFTPGPSIAMTWANDRVFFDVADDITNSGATASPPNLVTATKTFSGTFYLSGAGWVLFDTGSYQVNLDCGAQSLSLLSAPCTLSGTAWGEMIGDVTFESGSVQFDPSTALLSGTMATYMGDYSLSGVMLPLLPAEFMEGTGVVANHQAILTLSGTSRYYGAGSWSFSFQPTGYTSAIYNSLSSLDLSHASDYIVDITDQNGSKTTITDFKVVPWIPTSNLNASASSTIHAAFCTAYSTNLLCPDGATLNPMSLDKQPSAGTVIANGVDSYNFRLRIRDQYGNATSGGSVAIEYTDTVSEIQVPALDFPPYTSYWPGYATIGSWSLLLNQNGKYTIYSPSISWDITYWFASIAPTDATNSLTLSWILYTDLLWVTTTIPITPAMKAALIFNPWYSTSLSVVGDIVVWSGVDFTGALTHSSSLINATATSVYHIQIGSDNLMASFENFSGSPISCTKYFLDTWLGECNWIDTWFGPVVISTTASAFSGIYTPHTPDPLLESVSYKSYITYMTGTVRVMYPSASGSLWWAKYGTSSLLILGQNNVWNQYNGIKTSAKSDIWNTIRKSIALLSRNRTTYTDVDYTISTGATSIDNASFANKRSLIVIWADVTINQNITKKGRPLSIIVLTDKNGSGGNIHIADAVTDIEASLFSEHSIFSSGSNQLYIHGSLISANTTGDTVAKLCPYYVSPCVDPEKYDLEKIRPTFDPLISIKSSSPTAIIHPWVALIIEYDGRMLSDPPPGLSK